MNSPSSLVIALSAFMFFDAGAAAHEVPRIAFSSDDGPPLWVAASAVLRGDRQGQWSIRINDQWRVCFAWRDGNAYDVEIVDYH